ncbi:universal stress protein [Natrinema sp. HArc-T2]|uniref:universal stress protein n=1 Tax=Natrinema sp. HArc-T2 TaxID=3242701 RepID=UPI00359ECFDE
MFTVVLGIDTDTDRAVSQANTVAQIPCAASEITAILLHDFGENPQGGTVEQVGAVRRAREILEDADIDVELEGTSGDPATAIIHAADRHDADRIVLAGRKRTPTGKVLFGSVTQAVILNTTRPVLVCSTDDED